MVQTIVITGVTSARTTAIALTNYIPDKVRLLVSTRLFSKHSLAVANHTHGGVAHSHGGVAHSHAGVAHSHTALTVPRSNVAFSTVRALMLSAGSVVTSGAHGAFPLTAAATQNVGAATQNVAAATSRVAVAGGFTEAGSSVTNYTIDSNGRIVAAATHPAVGHANLKESTVGVSQIELGDALRSTDILVIAGLLQREFGGVF